MKKNKSMRAAGGLMIATLLSTSIVSGTYAKYVTSDSAKDSARVAKFGVEVKADGTLFDTTYKSVANENVPGAGETDAAILTVQSSNNDKLVAPGTKNDEGISFSVTGQPEVDVAVKIEIANTSDVWLGTGTYPNMTNGDVFDNKYVADNDIFTTTDAYYPIKYTLTQKTTSETKTLVTDGKLQDVIEKLNTVFNGGTAAGNIETVYDANTDLSDSLGTFQLTWEWDFDASGADKQDTLLGDLAAGNVGGAIDAINDANKVGEDISEPKAGNGVTAAADSYNLNTSLEFTITVTQID